MTTDRLIIGCGYLGLRAARTWRARGDRVAALTRSADRAQQFQAEGIEPILGDVTDRASLQHLPEARTVLYAVGLDRTSGKSQREVYVDGLRNVLAELHGRAERLIYISSTSVYGQNDGSWVDEESDCEPVSASGCVCREAEQLLSEIPTANILRLAGIYGPGRLIARAEQLQRGDPIKSNPDGWLNLIHVDDAVGAVFACDERGQAGRIYLVSDNQPHPRREFYGTVARLIGAPPPVFAPLESLPDSEQGLNKRCSNRRLREELGLTLQFPTIHEGLPHALEGGTP